MKLESLKSSKFEAFKGSELQNLIKINGGQAIATDGGSYSTGKTKTDSDGKVWHQYHCWKSDSMTDEDTTIYEGEFDIWL